MWRLTTPLPSTMIAIMRVWSIEGYTLAFFFYQSVTALILGAYVRKTGMRGAAMRILYIDNYRGFESTWIPIADVNFLVGENSTGKTSVLSLINVLGSFEFWFSQEFNNNEVELGAFKDIVSAGHRDADSFSVGVIECPDDGVFPSDDQRTFLMTFVQRSGMPRLKEWSFVDNDRQIRIAFGPKVARYTIKSIMPSEDLALTLKRTFRTWLQEPVGTARGYKQLHSTETRI